MEGAVIKIEEGTIYFIYPVNGGFHTRNRKAPILKIETEYIKLDSFLKAVNAAASGGEAKIIITEGLVRVNGEVETRRGRKLYPGDRVETGSKTFAVE